MARQPRHGVSRRATSDAVLATEEVRAELVAGFRAQLALYPDHLIETIALEHARKYGQRAARAAIAPAVWSVVLEDRWDTSQTVAHLGVSRQALAKRVASGSLVGMPGKGTTYYPTWQFDLSSEPPRVRPAVTALLSAWIEEAGRLDPFAVAAWARTPQPELGEATPIAVLDKEAVEDAEDRVIFSARVAAAKLAQ